MIVFSKNKFSGFTLIELMVAIAILVIVLAVAVPNFRVMIMNSQVRNATESIVNGLQKARAEAVARNTNVSFTLGAGSSWTVSVVNPASTIESRNSSEGSAIVTLNAVASDATAATTVTFNNLGGVVTPPLPIAQVDLTATGADKPLRVTIGLGGAARMCDPSLSLASNPRGC